jgi:hypothetical protein
MKATALYKTASVLLVVAAAGNSYGLVRFWQVAGAMNPVRFPQGHTNLSYAQVVLGLELFCSLCVLFAAYLAWHLGDLVRNTPQVIGALGWLLFAYQLVGVYISFRFFAGPVFILSTVLAICLGWAAWLSTEYRRREHRQDEGIA